MSEATDGSTDDEEIQATALLEWARDHGFTSDSEPHEVREKIRELVKFAGERGTLAQNLQELLAWAQQLGFRERAGLREISAAFGKVAENISPAGLEGAEIADEAAVNVTLGEVGPGFGVFAGLDTWQRVLAGQDAELRGDTLRMLAQLAVPPAQAKLAPAQRQAIDALAALVAAKGNAAEHNPPPDLGSRAKAIRMSAAELLRLALRQAHRALFDELDTVGQFIPFAGSLIDDLEQEARGARRALSRAPVLAKKSERDTPIPTFTATVLDIAPLRDAAGALVRKASQQRALSLKADLRLHLQECEQKMQRLRREISRAEEHVGTFLTKHHATLRQVGALALALAP